MNIRRTTAKNIGDNVSNVMDAITHQSEVLSSMFKEVEAICGKEHPVTKALCEAINVVDLAEMDITDALQKVVILATTEEVK